MLSSNSKFNAFSQRLRKESSVLTAISIGVFLFILFFQPFAINTIEFNNKLLIVAGLAGIAFLLMFLIRIIFYKSFQKIREKNRDTILVSYLSGFLIFVLSTVAFAFYLRYVGKVSITFFVVFKAGIICLVPPVILRISDSFYELTQRCQFLNRELKKLKSRLDLFETQGMKRTISFLAQNSAEELSLLASDVVLIRSADNYVEIIYKEQESFKVKLIRNTLKNIENQLKKHPNFIRCHRTCIINISKVENLQRKSGNHWLSLKDYEEQVPVSRQYLLQVKGTLPS